MEPIINAAHAGNINGRMIKVKKYYQVESPEMKKVRQDIYNSKKRHTIYKMYRCMVYMVGAEGRRFEATSLTGVHEAATNWLIEMKQWASYFKTNSPEIQFVFYTGSDTPVIEDSWEDVRYNSLVVGTDREVAFKDFESGYFWNGTELESAIDESMVKV